MMTIIGRSTRKYAVGLGILALCALTASAEESAQNEAPAKAESSAMDQSPEAAVQSWPARSRALAHVMIDKYGEPNKVEENDLVWYKNGPWSKTVVYRKEPRTLGLGRDILEQSVAYDVPDAKMQEIRRFNSRLKIDTANSELTSRAETEDLNFLALNLADEIVTDKRSVEDAREFYRKTIKLSESGKSSAYMSGFTFTPGAVKPADQTSATESSTSTSSSAASARELDESDTVKSPVEQPYRSGSEAQPDAHMNGVQNGNDVTTPPNP